MRLSFLIFTEIAKLNICEMFCNKCISKLNTRKMYFFPISQLSTRQIYIYKFIAGIILS